MLSCCHGSLGLVVNDAVILSCCHAVMLSWVPQACSSMTLSFCCVVMCPPGLRSSMALSFCHAVMGPPGPLANDVVVLSCCHGVPWGLLVNDAVTPAAAQLFCPSRRRGSPRSATQRAVTLSSCRAAMLSGSAWPARRLSGRSVTLSGSAWPSRQWRRRSVALAFMVSA